MVDQGHDEQRLSRRAGHQHRRPLGVARQVGQRDQPRVAHARRRRRRGTRPRGRRDTSRRPPATSATAAACTSPRRSACPRYTARWKRPCRPPCGTRPASRLRGDGLRLVVGPDEVDAAAGHRLKRLAARRPLGRHVAQRAGRRPVAVDQLAVLALVGEGILVARLLQADLEVAGQVVRQDRLLAAWERGACPGRCSCRWSGPGKGSMPRLGRGSNSSGGSGSW